MTAPDALMKTFVSLQAMKELRRQGAIFYGERMMEADTIAGHSFTVTCLAWFIAASFKTDYGSHIDVDKVIKMGLCHDMGEAITGDLPAPFKRMVEKLLGQKHKDILDKAELAAFTDLVSPLSSLCMNLPGSLDEFNRMKTKEAAIVKVADRLDAYVHALATKSVHHLIQAWGFYNRRLHKKLEEKANDPKAESSDREFWQSLADWFKKACDYLGGAKGLSPTIPKDEEEFSESEWLPHWTKPK